LLRLDRDLFLSDGRNEADKPKIAANTAPAGIRWIVKAQVS